jgi:hypothetical protein
MVTENGEELKLVEKLVKNPRVRSSKSGVQGGLQNCKT